MVLFPPAKINLGLHVLGKRPDGYHALESIFLPLAWTDILEVVVDPHVAAGDMKTTFTGLPIPGASDDNLVVKAHRILADQHDLPGLHLHLRKNLPKNLPINGLRRHGRRKPLVDRHPPYDGAGGTRRPLGLRVAGRGVGCGPSNDVWRAGQNHPLANCPPPPETLLAHANRNSASSDCPFFVDSAPYAMVDGPRGARLARSGLRPIRGAAARGNTVWARSWSPTQASTSPPPKRLTFGMLTPTDTVPNTTLVPFLGNEVDQFVQRPPLRRAVAHPHSERLCNPARSSPAASRPLETCCNSPWNGTLEHRPTVRTTPLKWSGSGSTVFGSVSRNPKPMTKWPGRRRQGASKR